MIGRIYKILWHNILGLDKPITYVARDFYHEQPIVFALITLTVGIIIGHILWGDKNAEDYERR